MHVLNIFLKNRGILKFHDIYLTQLSIFMHSYQNRTLPIKFQSKLTLQNQIHSYNTKKLLYISFAFLWYPSQTIFRFLSRI